jgi:hypothetical protein
MKVPSSSRYSGEVSETTVELAFPVGESVFSDVFAKVQLAVSMALEQRRRRGLPIVVNEGRGVEILEAGDY